MVYIDNLLIAHAHQFIAISHVNALDREHTTTDLLRVTRGKAQECLGMKTHILTCKTCAITLYDLTKKIWPILPQHLRETHRNAPASDLYSKLNSNDDQIESKCQEKNNQITSKSL